VAVGLAVPLVVVVVVVVVVVAIVVRVPFTFVHVMTQYEFQLYRGLQSRPTDGFQRLNSSGLVLK
jgi:hypothetical protein